MKDQNIEQLFKDTLGNFESEVNPEVWTNISQGLRTPVTGNPAAGSSAGTKTAGLISKLGLKGMLFISAATITVIGTIAYFVTEKDDSNLQTVNVAPRPENKVMPVETMHSSPPTAVFSEVKPARKEVTVKPASKENKNQPAKREIQSNPSSTTANPVQTIDAKSSAAIADHKPDNTIQQPNPATANAVPSPDPALEKEQEIEQPVAVQDPVFDANIENYLIINDNVYQKLPTIFTPNHDNLNDVFKIKAINLKSLEVIIFDHSGNKIYSWNSLDGEWDGKRTDGSEAPAGQYYYTLNGETLQGKICIAQSPLFLKRK